MYSLFPPNLTSRKTFQKTLKPSFVWLNIWDCVGLFLCSLETISGTNRNQYKYLGHACLNGRLPCSQHDFTSLDLDWNISPNVRLQVLYSHLMICTRVSWESLTSMVISLTLIHNLHQWLVIKWFLPCSTSRHCNHLLRFVSLWVRLEDPRLFGTFPRLWWSLVWVILKRSTLYWSWLCYHLIMDLRLCLVAMIVFSRSLLPWICIVLVGSHVMIYMRFESVIL